MTRFFDIDAANEADRLLDSLRLRAGIMRTEFERGGPASGTRG